MEVEEITREKGLRRAAARQGLRLSKSTRRDPRAADYGRYRIENPERGRAVVAGGAPLENSLDLDEVEVPLLPETAAQPRTRARPR